MLTLATGKQVRCSHPQQSMHCKDRTRKTTSVWGTSVLPRYENKTLCHIVNLQAAQKSSVRVICMFPRFKFQYSINSILCSGVNYYICFCMVTYQLVFVKKKNIQPQAVVLLKSYMSETRKTVVMHKGIDVLVFMIKNQNCDHLPSIFIRPSVSKSHLIRG